LISVLYLCCLPTWLLWQLLTLRLSLPQVLPLNHPCSHRRFLPNSLSQSQLAIRLPNLPVILLHNHQFNHQLNQRDNHSLLPQHTPPVSQVACQPANQPLSPLVLLPTKPSLGVKLLGTREDTDKVDCVRIIARTMELAKITTTACASLVWTVSLSGLVLIAHSEPALRTLLGLGRS
jgi:hypothetical protein